MKTIKLFQVDRRVRKFYYTTEPAVLPPKTKTKIKMPDVATPVKSKLYERKVSLKFVKKKSEIQKRKPNNKKKKYKPRRKVFGVSDGIAETKSLRRI